MLETFLGCEEIGQSKCTKLFLLNQTAVKIFIFFKFLENNQCNNYYFSAWYRPC